MSNSATESDGRKILRGNSQQKSEKLKGLKKKLDIYVRYGVFQNLTTFFLGLIPTYRMKSGITTDEK